MRPATLLVVGLLVLAGIGLGIYLPACSGTTDEVALFPAPVDGKWGYIDRTGTMVIEPRFDAAIPFSEGLAVVVLADQAGYIDETGTIVIQPQFYRTGGFHDGLASAGRYEAGVFREGYIDRKGAEASQQFDEAWSFREGLGLVRQGDTWGYVDTSGKIAIPIQFGSADVFSEGLAPACLPNDRYGYIDKTGSFAIKPQFGTAQPFSEGLAAVCPADGGKWGYIDKSGAIVIQPQFDMALGFSDGLAVVGMGQKDAIVDEAGAVMPAYGYKQYAYIDRTGKKVIEGEFEDASSFSGGLAAVCPADGGKWGYIDKTGAFAIQPQFDIAYDFTQDLALVCLDREADKWAYIDKTGAVIWQKTDDLT